MFPGASALGDSLQDLFNPNSAGQQQQNSYFKLQQENRLYSMQNMGVKDMPSENGDAASRNNPQYGNEKNKPAASEDPQEIEARWQARMAKFAGVASATGVKLGGV